jgi:putative hydroxymethylpyrimidine transport system ATP-binding protein
LSRIETTNQRPLAASGIRLSDARLSYSGRVLFDGLDLELPAGSTTCLLGPSGVGKTSLLRLVAGLDAAAEGTVSDDDGKSLHGRIAYMAQQDLLLPWLSVCANVTLGARLRAGGLHPSKTDKALELLRRVGLQHAADFRPARLSGGMRQRVALARTLMEDRPVVLMDEPFSALDAITRLDLQEMAAQLLRDRTVLLVTHDPLEALRIGHRIHVMSGRPARLDAPLTPSGAPPRQESDPELLELQGELLKRLHGAWRDSQ